MNGMTKRVVVGEAVALVAWLIVMLACQNVLMSPFVFYTSLLFGLLAFVVSAVSMALADRQGGSRAMTETGFGLSTVLSVGLFAVLLLVNTVFCFASFAWISTTLPVVVNVAILAVMVIARVGLDSHAKTPRQTSIRRRQRRGLSLASPVVWAIFWRRRTSPRSGLPFSPSRRMSP